MRYAESAMAALLTGLVLSAAVLLPASLTADDAASAEGVLKAAGLKRSGTSYVLPEEADVIKLEESVSKLQSKLDDLSQQYQRQISQRDTEKQAAAAERANANANPRNRGRYAASTRTHDAKANQYQQQANQIKQQAAQPDKDFKKQQADYKEKSQKLLKQYADLAAKPEIMDALRAVNRTAHPKCALGPASAYRKNIIKLMTDTLAKDGYKLEGNQYHLADESQLHEDLTKTLLLGREVGMFERRLAPADTKTPAAKTETKLTPEQVAAKRAELAEKVKSLRTRIQEVQARREAALADGEAQSCVEELNRLQVSKKKLELTTRGGLKTLIEEFDKLEQSPQAK